jgi:hypothetical protein
LLLETAGAKQDFSLFQLQLKDVFFHLLLLFYLYLQISTLKKNRTMKGTILSFDKLIPDCVPSPLNPGEKLELTRCLTHCVVDRCCDESCCLNNSLKKRLALNQQQSQKTGDEDEEEE